MTPQDELHQLDLMIAYARARRSEIRKQLNFNTKTGLMHARKGRLVATADIRPYIQEWLNKDHTLSTLADKAMVHKSVLQKCMNGSREWMSTYSADRILTALGITHVNEPFIRYTGIRRDSE